MSHSGVAPSFSQCASQGHVCGQGMGTVCQRLLCLLCTQVGPGQHCQQTNDMAAISPKAVPCPHIKAVSACLACTLWSTLWCRKVQLLLWAEQALLISAAATMGSSLTCLDLCLATVCMPYGAEKAFHGDVSQLLCPPWHHT